MKSLSVVCLCINIMGITVTMHGHGTTITRNIFMTRPKVKSLDLAYYSNLPGFILLTVKTLWIMHTKPEAVMPQSSILNENKSSTTIWKGTELMLSKEGPDIFLSFTS